MPAVNDIAITVLPDGTVRVETSKIGGPVHMAADKLLGWLAEQLGGEVTMLKHEHGHAHTHEHGHAHTHEHEKH